MCIELLIERDATNYKTHIFVKEYIEGSFIYTSSFMSKICITEEKVIKGFLPIKNYNKIVTKIFISTIQNIGYNYFYQFEHLSEGADVRQCHFDNLLKLI